jgi:hypothetical protein
MNNTFKRRLRLVLFISLILLSLLGVSCFALTPFTFQFFNSDGTTNFSTSSLSPYPTVNNLMVWNGSNIVISKPILLIPSPNGSGTNAAEPGGYRLTVTNTSGTTIQAFVTIPDTATQLPLGAYITGAPAVYTASSFFAFITNGLGGPLGLIQALQYQPMTNNLANLTNVLGLNGLTNLLGQNALTNLLGLNGATNLIGLNGATNLTGQAKVAGFTGTITNNSLGGTYRVNITNGFIISTNTP